MEESAVGKSRSWLVLAACLCTVLSPLGSAEPVGKGKGLRVVHLPPKPLHINAVYGPVIEPCAPVTKVLTSIETINQYVPVYQTVVEPVVVPTTHYVTKIVTRTNTFTKSVVETFRNIETSVVPSVAVAIDQVTRHAVLPSLQETTVTHVELQAAPSTVTVVKTVTRSSVTPFTEQETFVKTEVLHPEVTVTEVTTVPDVATQYVAVTTTVTEVVTITAPHLPPAYGAPRVTQTVEREDIRYTPAYVTQTNFVTSYATVTQYEQVPYTVNVERPCQGSDGGFSRGVVGGGGGGGGGGFIQGATSGVGSGAFTQGGGGSGIVSAIPVSVGIQTTGGGTAGGVGGGVPGIGGLILQTSQEDHGDDNYNVGGGHGGDFSQEDLYDY